jgi:hypothetical protein
MFLLTLWVFSIAVPTEKATKKNDEMSFMMLIKMKK